MSQSTVAALSLLFFLSFTPACQPGEPRDQPSEHESKPEKVAKAPPARSHPHEADRPARSTPQPGSVDAVSEAPEEEASAQHLLVMYQGSRRAPETITRTKEEARARAEEALKKARKGVAFSKLVAEYSDEPRAAEREGRLGIFTRRRMVPEFSEAVFNMQVNEISDIVETPFGFHVIKRLPIERVAARHILIMYQGSMRAPPTITRTKEEARARAQEVLRKARAHEDFTALAREYTDEPQSPGRTPGDLGRFGRGQMVPAFETAVFAMRVNEISDLVETPFGFHIIQRTE